MEYFDFLGISINENLTVEEKLKEIIRYHIIIEHNKKKLKNRKLNDF
jgi:hypothetical protein